MYHPIVQLPSSYLVFDHSNGPDPRGSPGAWGVGKYNEKRRGMYTTELFSGQRDIHLGIDIAGPIHTPVFAFDDGEIFLMKNNDRQGDYGPTLVTKHGFDSKVLFALWGHLAKRTLERWLPGDHFRRGDLLAWMGNPEENGGWPDPHVHFQISFVEPTVCDMPGVVAEKDLAKALELYPDPRLVLGALY